MNTQGMRLTDKDWNYDGANKVYVKKAPEFFTQWNSSQISYCKGNRMQIEMLTLGINQLMYINVTVYPKILHSLSQSLVPRNVNLN